MREIEAKFYGIITDLEWRMNEKPKKLSRDITQELPKKVNVTWSDHVKTSDPASDVKSFVKNDNWKREIRCGQRAREVHLMICRVKESN